MPAGKWIRAEDQYWSLPNRKKMCGERGLNGHAIVVSGQSNGGIMESMRDRSNLYALSGVCAVAASRILSRSHLLYDLDSVNFALGMRRFDPAAHQPHPPGYFLYVYLARLVNRLFPDPNTALVAIS